MELFDTLGVGIMVIIAMLLFFVCWAIARIVEAIERFSYVSQRRVLAYERWVNYKIEVMEREGSECYGTERDYDCD